MARRSPGGAGLAIGAVLAATLAGCATTGGGDGTSAPRELGLPDQLVPGSIGQQMTEQDRARIRFALDGNGNYEPSAWQDAEGRVVYRVTPIRTFNGAGGSRCRDFDTQATVDGRLQKIRSTACQQVDGSWRPLAD